MVIRRRVLGDDYVDSALNHHDALTVEFQQFMTTYCWGGVWTDDRLVPRERSLIVLAITAALGKMEEFEAHVAGALRNGITPDELISVLRQITVYCGVPVGVVAQKSIRKVLASASSNGLINSILHKITDYEGMSNGTAK